MNYTRNSDPEYYKKYQRCSNCGSYALRLQEWYDPDGFFEDAVGCGYEWIEEMIDEGYSDTEIANMYTDILTDGMLMEFEGELTVCDGRPPCSSDEELIALNTFVYYGDDGGDYDFHFKVFRNGKWSEKCGVLPVEECDEDDWGRYNGDPVYMYHYIGE